MFTPSLVLAYLTCGSITLAPCRHRPHPHRLPDALQRLLAAVLEGTPAEVRASERTVSDTSTSPGAERPLMRDGDVDGAAVDVVVLADDVAGVEAEVEGEAGVVARPGAGERGLDRLAGAGEDGEDAVAEELAFDGGAGVVADDGAEGGVEVARLRAEGGVAEALGEGGGVDDVGEEDDGGARRPFDRLWRRVILLVLRKKLERRMHQW